MRNLQQIHNIQYMEKKVKVWTLDHFPGDDFPKDLSCYKWTQKNSRELKDGQVRVAVTYLTVDPVSRVWISGARSYLDPIKPGDPIPSFGLGRAIESKWQRVKPGDLVGGVLSWSEEHIAKINDINPVPIDLENDFQFLTIYGPTGLTAYCSYEQQIKQYPKQTHIVISSAGGAVGIALVLFLKAEGYQNIYGIAGSDQKCRYVESIGANFCLNYKTQDITAQLKKRIPGGVEIFYDNVGEDVLDAVLPAMKEHSKVVMCGATATYTKWKDKIGIKNYALAIMKRIKFKGILYFHQHKKLIKAMISISGLGVKGPEAIIDGLENAPTTLRDHYFGKYLGKPLVRVRTFTPEEIEKLSSQ